LVAPAARGAPRALVTPGVIRPLGADGSLPFDEIEPRGRRLSDRAVMASIGLALLLVAGAVTAVLVVGGHRGAAPSTGDAAAAASAGITPSTTQDGRDLSQVSNAEMEAVVAANPDVVPMRLALVERYLDAADKETTVDGKRAQLQKAQFHAGEAADRATTSPDRAKALRYLGWTTALLDDPTRGAGLLQESLVEEPNNPDALWFLAKVDFDKLHDAATARQLLEQLLAQPIADDQRATVQAELDQITGTPTG
jgi:hypothetical protein